MTATTNKAAENTTCHGAAATKACCDGATEAFKAAVETNQKMFNAFMGTFMKGWNMDAFTSPAASMPAAFDKVTKAMNALVDSNARFATECNALLIDAVRTNARTVERTGDMLMGQFNANVTRDGAKSAKPATETAREILDEAYGFATKTGERLMKMNNDRLQRLSEVMDELVTVSTTKA